MQKWKKIGLIFKPHGKGDSFSHCQPPTPYHLENSTYRIFYGSRNEYNLSQIFFFDFDLDILQVVYSVPEPILKAGDIGCFDHDGIYPSSLIRTVNGFFLYTIGYTKGIQNLFYMRIGLAHSTNLSRWEKCSPAPILNPSSYDPWIVTAPCVIEDNGLFRMWYVSGDRCKKRGDGSLQSFYHIKYAESRDGILWERNGLVSIDYIHPGETNIARPWVIKEDGIYKAWYCYIVGNSGYQIGYAESQDGGYTFERKDHLAGIKISDEPWENEAVAYPAVIAYNGKKYMFYNGNKFGKDGIALAVEE